LPFADIFGLKLVNDWLTGHHRHSIDGLVLDESEDAPQDPMAILGPLFSAAQEQA
jgi:hypothetical protein